MEVATGQGKGATFPGNVESPLIVITIENKPRLKSLSKEGSRAVDTYTRKGVRCCNLREGTRKELDLFACLVLRRKVKGLRRKTGLNIW